jgi:PLP dependent protein
MGIRENISKIEGEIGDARLVVVTKCRSVDEIELAIDSGAKIIGENRVKEFKEKVASVEGVEKHMIGHLQRNKVKEAVQLFDCIESVDSVKLVIEIDKRAKEVDKVMPIFLEVKFEEQKHGFSVEELDVMFDEINRLKNIEIVGLMCMAPLLPEEETRPYFKKMKELKDKYGVKELSMGMSNDYKVAVEEGSTLVRVGTAIFE